MTTEHGDSGLEIGDSLARIAPSALSNPESRPSSDARPTIPNPGLMDQTLINRIVEAALLAASQPMSLAALQALFGEEEPAPAGSIEAALATLQDACDGRGVELVEVASGWRYQVQADVHPYITRMWTERKTRYTRATLETLALIAYRQPITRGEIEQVRGVAVSTNIIQALEEREWIRVVGHRDVPGKPALFGTTRTFLDYFGLKRLDELPPLSDIRDLGELEPQLPFDAAPIAAGLSDASKAHGTEIDADADAGAGSDSAPSGAGTGEVLTDTAAGDVLTDTATADVLTDAATGEMPTSTGISDAPSTDAPIASGDTGQADAANAHDGVDADLETEYRTSDVDAIEDPITDTDASQDDTDKSPAADSTDTANTSDTTNTTDDADASPLSPLNDPEQDNAVETTTVHPDEAASDDRPEHDR